MKDIIVIGAGTAGMTAALYSLRNGKTVLILESEAIGGQIASSPRVENFPSIKQISGSEFSDNLFEQISDLGVEFELDKVLKVEKNVNYFTVTGEYNTYEAKAVIIATGVKHKKIHLPMEDELVGKGVSYCAVCDGPFYSGKDVALIGDGNTALQYSLLLANYCNKIYVCTLFDKFFGDLTLVKRLKEKENITVIPNVALKEFKYDDELTGLVFKSMTEEKNIELNVSGVFIAIGQMPDNSSFSNLVDLDKDGYIMANDNMETKTKGLFVCGDCRSKKIRQLTTAVADGAIASISAVNYID